MPILALPKVYKVNAPSAEEKIAIENVGLPNSGQSISVRDVFESAVETSAIVKTDAMGALDRLNKKT